MSIATGLVEWSKEALLPLGPLGLFLLAFMESSFFPLPPDLLLIPLVLVAPELWIFYALITTIGSVVGSLFGYWIGKKGGRPVLIKLAGKERTRKTESYFRKYGKWAIGIAGFTPIPYKIFTIAAGAFHYNIKNLVIVSIISRGARFFIVAGVVAFFGESIIEFFDTMFGLYTLLIAGVVILAYYFYRKFKQRK